MRLLTIVDVDALWRTAWSAAVAGIGVCIIFSLAVVGTTKSGEARRERRVLAGAGYGLLGFAGIAGTLAAVAYGVVLLTTK